MTTRTVALKVSPEGRVALAAPGECPASGYTVTVGGVPAGVSPGAVCARYAKLVVRWPVGAADRALHWGAIANLPCGAVVRPEADR